jgi:hypothetical protein
MSQNYSFGAATFSSFIWLKGGALFKNPNFLEIEMTTSGRYGVEVHRPDGSIACSAQRDNPHAGWHTFHFRQGGECGAGVPNGDYIDPATRCWTQAA